MDKIITDPQEIRNLIDNDILNEERITIVPDREKEIKYLIYIKSQLIKQTKKEIKNLNYELETLEGTKRLEKKRGRR